MQRVPGQIRFISSDPDEQEFLYSYDPETELNMDDETLEKERIQNALWRSGGFRVIPPPSPLVSDWDADAFLKQFKEKNND